MDQAERLQNVFRKVFQNEKLVISGSTSAKEIKMWDSLTHLELIAAVEEEFNMKLSFNEVMQLDTVKDLLDVIEKKSH